MLARRRAAWSRTAGSPGSGRRAHAPAADRAARRRRRARCCPASSTATPTWSSPATGPPSSPPGWPAQPYTGGGIRTTVAATRAATDDELRRQRRAGCVGEALRQGTTTIEIKSGYGLTVADEARVAADRRRAHRRDHVPRRARGARRVRRPTRTTTSTWSAAPMLDAVRPVRPLGRRVLRAGRLRRRPGPGGPDRRQRRRARRRGCTPTSSAPGPGVQLAVELGAASADHCTHLTDADVDALAGSAHRGHAAARRRVLHPVAVPGRPPAARRRASPSRWPPTATPARRTPRRCRSASRSPSARCG